MTFIRFGGLSLVNQKERYKLDSYHAPPARKGLYCFHPEFVVPFLYYWKKDGRKDLDSNKRVFKYNGYIWTHIYFPKLEAKGYYFDHNKEWHLTHTRYLEKIFSKEIASMNKCLLGDKYMGKSLLKENLSRYAWRWSSKDHMELFISDKV